MAALLAALCLAPAARATINVSLQMQLGNPSGATADTNNHNHFLVQRSVQALDYSDNLGQPVWASWDLTSGTDVGAADRSTLFYTDTNLPPNFYWVTDNDYNGVGNIDFNRGHMCPSEDRTDTRANNDAVFYMSNIIPQSGPNNQGLWANFESYCRALAATNELLIICGPSGFGTSKIPSGKAYIASNVWKIVVCATNGTGLAINRLTANSRVIALSTPNVTNGLGSWSTYVTTARQIEQDTGFNFFTALPGPIASAFRARIDGFTNSAAPAITNFSPVNGLVNSNIVISGLRFSSALAVKFNGTSASYYVNSDNQVVATVPTNATTGPLSITTPAGTFTTSSNFTLNAAQIPDLAVTLTHTGNFMQADPADTYTIVVTNAGTGATTGLVSVVTTLPAGLTATGLSGTGWTNNLATLTSTRSDALAPGATYPAITLTVSVATNAANLVTNKVTVSGGGQTNTLNDLASDVTIINVLDTNAVVTLIGWDMSTLTNYGPAVFAPTTNATRLIVAGLTRGPGVYTNTSGGTARAWGGVSLTNTSSTNAISAGQYATFSVMATNGYTVSFSSVSKLDYRRSSTGTPNGLLQYQLGTNAFVNLTNLDYSSTASAGASLGPIDLSGVAALQNVGAGTNVTFRIVSWGGSGSSGTWYLYDVGISTALDVALTGVVKPVTAVAITNDAKLATGSYTAGGVTLTYTNVTANTAYYLQSTTNFIVWQNLVTNTATAGGQVQFTTIPATNGQRFYRVGR